MKTRKPSPAISDADYTAAMIRFYHGYTTEELKAALAIRKTALDDGFLTRKERAEFTARIDQMSRALSAREV